MSIDSYDILNILGQSINSTTYKVRHKETKEVLIWHTVDCENLNPGEVEFLTEKLNKRKELCHPNILKFSDFIDHKESKVVYIVTEYCENGSLRGIIESCLANDLCISEELVCKILYQIAFTIKTTDNYVGKLTTKEIFLDEDCNVKLYNFKIQTKHKSFKEPKMSYLGLAIYEACTLKTFDKSSYENEIKEISGGAYSASLLSLIVCMIKDNSDLKKNINKVLCHPTVLMKSSQWIKEKSFLRTDTIPKSTSTNKSDQDEIYTSRLEKLRKKEVILQMRQQQLNEKERQLAVREKKVVLMERAAKEKIQQAELYLKRCREVKYKGSDSSKSSNPSHSEKKSLDENLDSTYVSCGDSVVLPTSTKLNVSKIIKPAPFTRTLSERRIRFKGHSPLKEMDINRRRSIRQSKAKNENVNKRNSEWSTCSEDTERSSRDGSTLNICNKSRQLFSGGYENDPNETQCKPLTWTEESKKYAFELLKVMNDKENQCGEVKHTYL